MVNKTFKHLTIEIRGWLIIILFFLSIWNDMYRWKLFFTAIFLLIWLLLEVNGDMKKRGKNEKK